MSTRRLDVVCLGRCSVDLYSEQIGGRLEDVQSFAKYVGGCPANIAVGTARLGLKSALISRVGDEQLGRFICETLRAEGVDVSQVTVDPARLTALVILGIQGRATFPHIFYRTDCADMALTPEHIDREFIARARALVVSGTHLSAPSVEAASRAAIGYARAAGARIVLDIDYRPVLWGLAATARGEERFVASARVTALLQTIVPECDLIVGTEEEVHIAGGTTDTLEALRTLRRLTHGVIALKRGVRGCIIFPEEIPSTVEQGIVGQGFAITVLNTLGAGDAFMSGLLSAWLKGESWETCARHANACGAIVTTRHGCAPAMPTAEELGVFLASDRSPAELARLERLHRVTMRRRAWPEVHALAFDHRRQLEALADRFGVKHANITRLKTLIAEGARQGVRDERCAGAIIDERYGSDILEHLSGSGWWLARPVELPGSRPLTFEHGPATLVKLRHWPADHIVKCLVFYHPDDPPELRHQQEQQLLGLYGASVDTGHELLLEVIPPEDISSDSGTLARVLDAFYARGIYPDWWKIPPPADGEAWREITHIVERRDPHCRGVLLLGLDAPDDVLKHGFDLAAGQPLCKGFAIGRSIFRAPAEAWLEGTLDDQALIAEVARNYRRIIELWQDRGR